MEDVIHYLQLKNQYYEKFYSITSKFWQSIQSRDWSKVAEFTEQRDKILHLIRTYDFKISETLDGINLDDKEYEAYRDQVTVLLTKRKEWVDKIVEIDLLVIGIIDEMKTEKIHELENTIDEMESALSPNSPLNRKVESV